MNEGPINAGSIKGELKLDASNWFDTLAAADAAARKLASVDPTVSIDVDDNGAVTKLAAVDAAAKRLDSSNRQLAVSQQALNNTNSQGVQRWQLIAAGIAALIPLLGPLAGYAAGVGGALGGMGVAGVLAIIGITKAIKDATVAGVAYQHGLDQLKGTLNTLSSTAANRMLSSFNTAIAQINIALPNLNNQVGVFAGYAGRIGTTLLQGVINALQTLNPLFVQGAGYVEQLAVGFESWTANGGLERFTTYATQVFPQVAATLGSLASLALHVAEGFAGWGGPILTVLKAVADALNAIPAPLLPAVAAGALAVTAAFRGWSAVKSSIDGVNGSLSSTATSSKAAFASIVQGVAAADVAILQGISSLSSGIKQWQGLTNSGDKWSEAIRKGNIDVNNLGRTLQSVGGFWNDFANNADIAGTSIRPLYDNVKALDQAIASATPEDAAKAYKQLQEQMKLAGHSSADMATMFPAATAAIHAQQQASKEAANAAKDHAQGLDDASASAKKMQDAETKLNDTLKNLGSDQLNASSATIAFSQSVADASQAIKDNGATLDVNTQQGRDNQKALNDIAQSGIQLVSASQQAGASTGDLTAKMQSARDSFIAAATQMGLNSDQANRLADQYGLVPKNVDTAFNTSGYAAAAAAAAALKAQYEALQGVYTIRVNSIIQRTTLPDLNGDASGSGRPGMRDGGTVHAASGITVPGPGSSSTDSVHAMLAPYEEVISNRFGQAANNRMLLKAINAGASPSQVAAAALAQAGLGRGSSSAESSRNEPIYADGIGLIGWVRQIAGQQAQLVWNRGQMQMAQELESRPAY